jgi:phage/plasmid-associated DNA primase
MLMKVFADIFPEPDVFTYMLCLASTGLDSREASGIFTALVGGGQNGKTFFMKMVHNTLGNQYCAALKSALLTSPNERGDSANSSQMQMRGKTMCYFDEFNKSEIINVSRLKSLANPGYQSGRDLHEKQSNFKNTCNVIALSNYEFIIEMTDHGTWRRFYSYRNKVKFCENPDPNNIYEKKVNTKLIEDVANNAMYLEDMLSILTEYNRILRTEYCGDIKNIPVPTIKYETEVFRNKQDSLNRFITTHMVHSPQADNMAIVTISNRYREWYKQWIKKELTSIDAESQLENSRLSGDMFMYNNNKMLKGYRIKSTPEEPLCDGESTINEVTPRAVGFPPADTCNTGNNVPVVPQVAKKILQERTPVHIQNSDVCIPYDDLDD